MYMHSGTSYTINLIQVAEAKPQQLQLSIPVADIYSRIATWLSLSDWLIDVPLNWCQLLDVSVLLERLLLSSGNIWVNTYI